MEKKQNTQQINIELDESVSGGEYSNFVVVTHSPAEFVMDFIRVLPGMTKSKVKSRLIMAPMHAKTLMHALKDNIKVTKVYDVPITSIDAFVEKNNIDQVCFVKILVQGYEQKVISGMSKTLSG